MPGVNALAFAVAAAAVLIPTAARPEAAINGGRKFTTTLTGAQEINPVTGLPGAGDPDGTGTANIVVNIGQQRVCWDITVANIAAPTRGHIHNAPAGQNGAIVVGFFEAANVDLEDCTTQPVPRELLLDIIQNPQNYYENVHNAQFPGGAIRGQLSK